MKNKQYGGGKVLASKLANFLLEDEVSMEVGGHFDLHALKRTA